MGFWEELPDRCPPSDAVDDAIPIAYRIVYSDPPAEEHFRSNRYLNRPLPPNGDLCRHSSCSLFRTKERAKEFTNFPKVKYRGPMIAHLSIGAGAGAWKEKRDHIDLWIYDDATPLLWVSAVETAS